MSNRVREVPVDFDNKVFNDAWDESWNKAARKVKEILAEPRPITSPNFHGCPGGPEHIRRMFGTDSELFSTNNSEIGE